MRWIVVLIVVTIYCFAMSPIDKWLRKRITNKYTLFFTSFTIGFCILFGLYCLAGLAGF